MTSERDTALAKIKACESESSGEIESLRASLAAAEAKVQKKQEAIKQLQEEREGERKSLEER
jgi:multidrug resistance efflux pump